MIVSIYLLGQLIQRSCRYVHWMAIHMTWTTMQRVGRIGDYEGWWWLRLELGLGWDWYVVWGRECCGWFWLSLNCPDAMLLLLLLLLLLYVGALCAAVADDYCFTPPPSSVLLLLLITIPTTTTIIISMVLSGRFNDAQIIAQIDFILIGR